VLEVQHGSRDHDGRLHDLPELRRFEMRLMVHTVPHALWLEFPPAT